MADFDGSRTVSLSRVLTEARMRAQENLWAEMDKRGLRREDGWSIVELTREASGGTQIVMRPLHLRQPPPEDLECIVSVVEDTAKIQVRCSGEEADGAGN